MNCLFLTYENPFTLDAGDHIYTHSVIKALYDITGEVDIVYYDTNPNQSLIGNYPYGKSYCVKFVKKNIAAFIFTSRPAPITNRLSQKYLLQVEELIQLKAYDLIVVNHFKMSFLIDPINYWLTKYYQFGKTLLITHNSEYLLSVNLSKYHKNIPMRLAYYIDSERIKIYEEKQLNKFDYVSCISENDQDFFEKKYQVNNTLICRPVIYSQGKNHELKKAKDAIICGSFHWGPKQVNLQKFLNAKNLNLLNDYGIKLYVVGKSDKALVNAINNKYKGVHMTGPVNSTHEYYDKTTMAIVPEKLGGGFKLKVIEAAINKNLIIAIEGAITKSNLKKDVHFIECKSFEDIVTTVTNVVKGAINEVPFINNAYNLVKEEYSEDKLKYQLMRPFMKRKQTKVAVGDTTFK